MRPIQRYRQELAREKMAADGYVAPEPGVFRPDAPELLSMALIWRMPDGSIFEQEAVHPAVCHLEPRLLLDTADNEARARFRAIRNQRTPA